MIVCAYDASNRYYDIHSIYELVKQKLLDKKNNENRSRIVTIRIIFFMRQDESNFGEPVTRFKSVTRKSLSLLVSSFL